MVEQLMGQFREVETGKREDAVQRRPQLQAALTAYKRQKAIPVIAKPDRLTRNTHFITGLRKSKVDFVACDYPFADTIQIQVAGRVRRARAVFVPDEVPIALLGVGLGGKAALVALMVGCAEFARDSREPRDQLATRRCAVVRSDLPSTSMHSTTRCVARTFLCRAPRTLQEWMG